MCTRISPPVRVGDLLRCSFGVCSPCQPSENVLDVGVVSSGLGDGDAELSVAQGPDGCDDARDDPDHQRHAHRAGVLQDALRTDEDPRADDVTFGMKAEVAVRLYILPSVLFLIAFFNDCWDFEVLNSPK